MASIEQRKRADGGISARVMWRLGGSRDGRRQVETFSAGTDEQNLVRAEGFRTMVEAAGQQWPDGWVKREGFVRTHAIGAPGADGPVDRYSPPPSFAVLRTAPATSRSDERRGRGARAIHADRGQVKRYRSTVRLFERGYRLLAASA